MRNGADIGELRIKTAPNCITDSRQWKWFRFFDVSQVQLPEEEASNLEVRDLYHDAETRLIADSKAMLGALRLVRTMSLSARLTALYAS